MLPPPPSANVYWRTMVIKLKNPSPKQRAINGGHSALTMASKEAKAYIAMVKARIHEKGLNFMSKAPIQLDLTVCMGTNGRADISNRVKVIEDALVQAGVFEDDCQVVKLSVERGPVVKGGRIIVNVTEVLPDPLGAMQRSRWNGS